MKFLDNLRKKKEEKKVMNQSNNIIQDMICDKALKENKEKELKIRKLKKENKNLQNNLEVLATSIEEIRKICNDSKGKVVSKAKILNIIGG